MDQQLVSWYFEPSQPQRVTSWLKTMFNLAPIYSARKSSNHELSTNHKISPDTNPRKNKQPNKKQKLTNNKQKTPQTSNTKFSKN